MQGHIDKDLLRKVISAVKEDLGLRTKPSVVKDHGPQGSADLVRPDLVLRSGKSLILVVVKYRITSDDLAMALLMGRLEASRATPTGEVHLVLLAKVVPEDVRSAAARVGVHVIQLDWAVELPIMPSKRKYSPTKLSSDVSWRVILWLLRSGPSSIRRVALGTGASYGWTHATVMRLIERGVAERTPRGIAINDAPRLLNGVAWERPLLDLQVTSFKVGGGEMMQSAMAIEAVTLRKGVAHAFTGPTAVGFYTGYAHRFDRLSIYLDKEDVESVRNVLEDPAGSRSLEVFRPDRAVFKDTEEHEGLTLVSPAQALLDITGFGYSYWDFTLKMVEHIAELSHKWRPGPDLVG